MDNVAFVESSLQASAAVIAVTKTQSPEPSFRVLHQTLAEGREHRPRPLTVSACLETAFQSGYLGKLRHCEGLSAPRQSEE